MAKVVYFTRSSEPLSTTPPHSSHTSPFLPSQQLSSLPTQSIESSHKPINKNHESPSLNTHSHAPFDPSPPEQKRPTVNGALTPGSLTSELRNGTSIPIPKSTSLANISSHPKFRRNSVPPPLPGGLLNFARFETDNIDELIVFLQDLISTSAKANRVSLEKMKKNVKVMATGGGAHLFYEKLKSDLGVEVRREEEMECLILGLGFVARVPEEVFWFSKELVYKVSHPDQPLSNPSIAEETLDGTTGFRRTIPPSELPRPSPTPPAYQVTFANPNDEVQGDGSPFPCLVVNIGSGVSIVKVDEEGKFERVSGTSLGGGTLWGLLSLLTDAATFDGECVVIFFPVMMWISKPDVGFLWNGRLSRWLTALDGIQSDLFGILIHITSITS